LRRLVGLCLGASSKAGAHHSKGAPKGADGVRSAKNGTAGNAEDSPAVVPDRFFRTMSHVLNDAIGPIAVATMEDQIAVLGETRNAFPTPRLSQLVIGISREIRDESIRKAFLRRMSDEYWAIYRAKPGH